MPPIQGAILLLPGPGRDEFLSFWANNHPRISQEPGLARIRPYGARIRA